jgi:mannose-1-phosphate guanylyltransferase
MDVTNGYAVILAGGKGERFWPLSTSRKPKQFLSVFYGRTLLAQAVARLDGLIRPEHIFIITNRAHVRATAHAVPEIPRANIIGEPVGRDTAAAVALGAAMVKARDANGVFCVLTADQIIKPVRAFQSTLNAAMLFAAQQHRIVTIGIRPKAPSTGFGYIETGERLSFIPKKNPVFAVRRFVEKPAAATARAYVRSSRYFWNSGMFVMTVATLEKALARFSPPLAGLLIALARTAGRVSWQRILSAEYAKLKKISIDYAIMEKSDNLAMIESRFEWDDVGSWPALANHFRTDKQGNVVIGKVALLDCENTIAISPNRLTALMGLRDLVIIQAPNSTLVCARNCAQDLKQLVSYLGNVRDYRALL